MNHPIGLAASHSVHVHQRGDHALEFKRRFFISLALSLPVAVLSMPVSGWLGILFAPAWLPYALLALATAVFGYGGWSFLRGAYDELRSRKPGMMTLVAVAITTAFVYSTIGILFGIFKESLLLELVTLVDIMLVGHFLEMKSAIQASRALTELAELMPHTAYKLHFDGRTEEVMVGTLVPGDKVLVKPGEKIPVDGRVARGETSVNESALTGESAGVFRGEGDSVVGGSINGEGAIVIEITKVGADTYIASVIELVRHASSQKSQTQNLADRAAVWLTLLALFGGLITLAVWMLFGASLGYAIERAVAVMVIACPHALGLATPLVVSFSSSLAARQGILIRNRNAFEQLRNVGKIVFDKTGTLTEGRFQIQKVLVFEKYTEDEIIKLAGSVESKSEHAIARAIATRVKYPDDVIRFKAIPGKGAEGEVLGKHVAIVSPKYLAELKPKWEQSAVTSEAGNTIVWVLINMKVVGAIVLADTIRKSARTTRERARNMEIELAVMSGDNESATRRIADELGITDYHAAVSPGGKADLIRGLQSQYEALDRRVVFVGDGINDAPAITAADIGIATGAGTHVAIESADLILVKDDLAGVLRATELSKMAYRKMVQNLWWALGYNIIALPLAAGVLAPLGVVLSPSIGAILMSASTIVVVFNALLLKKSWRTY